eukprot:1159665-Pelagomonas_calceolata.AAC.3
MFEASAFAAGWMLCGLAAGAAPSSTAPPGPTCTCCNQVQCTTHFDAGHFLQQQNGLAAGAVSSSTVPPGPTCTCCTRSNACHASIQFYNPIPIIAISISAGLLAHPPATVLDNSLDLIQQQPAPGAGAAWSPYRKLTSMHAGMMQQSALSTLTVSGRALCKQCTPKRRWIVQT